MSETVNPDQGINININNSDSNQGSSPSILDRIFDIGLKLIIPLGLILALIVVVVLVRVVLPLIQGGTELFSELGIGGKDLFFGLGGVTATVITGIAATFGIWIGR